MKTIMTVMIIGMIVNTAMVAINTVLLFKIRRWRGKSDADAELQYTYADRWNTDDVLSGKMADDFFRTYYSSSGKIGEDDTAG